MRDFGDVQPYCYLLSRVGTASGLTNNVAQPLSGVWSQQPVVAVGLSSIQTYDPAPTASLYISTGVSGTTYSGNGVYSASAYARLSSVGGQHPWGVVYGPTRTNWDIGTSPSIEYTTGWSDTYSYITSAFFYLELETLRSTGWGYMCQTTTQVYLDYVRQDTGATASQLVYEYIIGTAQSGDWYSPYTLTAYITTGTLSHFATRVRARVVTSNGPGVYPLPSGTAQSSHEVVYFRGITLYKSGSSGSTTLYDGSVFALAVGR